jgi:hypothetical protein
MEQGLKVESKVGNWTFLDCSECQQNVSETTCLQN